MKYIIFSLAIFLHIACFGQWTPIGGNALRAQGIYSIKENSKGDLYAMGSFNINNKILNIAKFDGTTWVQIDSISDYFKFKYVQSFAMDNQDNIYISNVYNTNGGYYFIGKYDGTNLTELKGIKLKLLNPFNSFNANKLYSDNLNNIYYVGPTNVDTSCRIYKYNGLKWDTIAGLSSIGQISSIIKMCFDKNNTMYFVAIDTQNNYKVIQYKNAVFKELGKFDTYINCIDMDNKNNVYIAGGDFNNLMPGSFIYKFDGSSWSIVGNNTWKYDPDYLNFSMYIDSINNIHTISYTNKIYYYALFNGNKWTYVDFNSFINSIVYKILPTKNNSLLFAGGFKNDSGFNYVAKYVLNNSSIPSISTQNSYKIYPIPATKTLTIEQASSNLETEIYLMDMSGRTVLYKKEKNARIWDLDIESLQQGIYLLHIVNKDGDRYYKVAKD